MKTLFIVACSLFFTLHVFAQPSQTVRGKIFEQETNLPAIDIQVQIKLADTNLVLNAKTDLDGLYEFKNVPVGKHQLMIKSNLYQAFLTSITVNSGKELIVDIPVQELINEMEDIVIVAQKDGEVKNEMATVSAQQFSVEETERFAGSRGDPARMASNFAGVQGADDSRNDIVIRGNSPLGIVYKVEGIDIPNPSHFAISGSTGGPVSIINNKSLANSDFFMSAFPAEYGNSISGIFDLKMRNGNNKQHEFSGQFGFLGTEVLMEGPLSKNKRASYLVMGRYSTLSLFQKIGVQIGTDAVPIYGDGAFKFTFPLKNNAQLSLWGIGGKSNIAIKISNQTTYSEEFYGEGDRDQYFGTSMLSSGLTLKKTLNEKIYWTSTLAYSYDEQHANHNYLIRTLDTVNPGPDQTINISVDSIYPLMGYSFKTSRIHGYTSFNYKINKQHILRFGLNADQLIFNNIDSVLNVPQTAFINRWNYTGGGLLVQPFIQWKYRISEAMDFTAGLHAQAFTFSKSYSLVEPRLGWKYAINKTSKVFAGAGLHSQAQPYYVYTYHQFDGAGNKVYHNKNMDFSKSFHSAIGFEKALKKGFNIRTEVYYQYLYQIPVDNHPSSFSIINQGSGFARFFPDTLVNEGTGRNYGIELTVQKYFDKSFYILFTTSVYDSKYKGSDGILRNTSYNGLYASNLLFGKEFKLNSKNMIALGGKVTVAGGKRYGYVDIPQTNLVKEIIFSDSLYNERQFKDYFRADLKILWRMNATKVTHEIGLDLVNVLNTRNLLGLAYAPNLADPSVEPLAEKTQLGFLPIFYYKIEFKLGKKE